MMTVKVTGDTENEKGCRSRKLNNESIFQSCIAWLNIGLGHERDDTLVSHPEIPNAPLWSCQLVNPREDS